MPPTVPDDLFTLPVPVTSAEVDEQEHLSNVAVVDLFNRATLAHSIARGLDIPAYKAIGGMFVVRRHEIDYRAMAFLNEQLLVSTWVISMEKMQAERRHRLVRPSDGAVIAEGRNFWVYVNVRTGRPQRIPDEILKAFRPATAV